jgi:cell division protein FtsL
MTPPKTILVLVLATAMGLTLVWQASRRRRIGYQLNDLEGAIAEQRVLRESYRTDVSTLRNPARLMMLVERYGLNLEPREPAPTPDTALEDTSDMHAETPEDE